jgi:hypothetical protein
MKGLAVIDDWILDRVNVALECQYRWLGISRVNLARSVILLMLLMCIAFQIFTSDRSIPFRFIFFFILLVFTMDLHDILSPRRRSSSEAIALNPKRHKTRGGRLMFLCFNPVNIWIVIDGYIRHLPSARRFDAFACTVFCMTIVLYLYAADDPAGGKRAKLKQLFQQRILIPIPTR